MTRLRLAQVAGIVLALFAGSAVAQTAEVPRSRIAIVVAGAAAEQPATLARARAAAEDQHAQLRVVRGTAEQLGVTHLLAAEGYDRVVTVGVDRRIAIDPVARRYPRTQFEVAGLE